MSDKTPPADGAKAAAAEEPPKAAATDEPPKAASRSERGRLQSIIVALTRWKTIFIFVTVVSCWIIWTNWYDIVDHYTDIDKMQERVAISVATPTVHTRERLLNDRFEQVAWLNDELAATGPQKTLGLSADPNPKQDVISAGEKTVGSESPASHDQTVTNRSDVRTQYGFDDPRQGFELLDGFRDVLRAERARSMLDDRHDMDDNTLDLFSFDATVMPRNNARGSAAVEVILTQDERDLWPDSAGYAAAVIDFKERKHVDLFDTYVGWLEKVRDLQQSNLKTLTRSLDNVELAQDRGDYENVLLANACSEFLRAYLPPQPQPGASLATCRAALAAGPRRDVAPGQMGPPTFDQLEGSAAADAIVAIRGALPDRTKDILKSRPAAFLRAIWPDVSSRLKLPTNAGAAASSSGGRAMGSAPSEEISGFFKDPESITNECSSIGLVDGEVDVVQGWLRPILSAQTTIPTFHCSQIIRNPAWRALYALIVDLQAAKSFSERVAEQIVSTPGEDCHRSAGEGCGGRQASNADTGTSNIFPGIQMPAKPTDPASIQTSCLAGMLLREGLIRPSAEQPRNHGAALAEFFDIRIETVSGGCVVAVLPRIYSLRSAADNLKDDDDFFNHGSDAAEVLRSQSETVDQKKIRLQYDRILRPLGQLLEGPGYSDGTAMPRTMAYAYSLSPRLEQNVQVNANQANSASIGLGRMAIELGQVRGLDYRDVEPEVIGFTPPAPSRQDYFDRGARFGWLMTPKPNRDAAWTVPLEQAQLSAVVSLPSWWRSALLQICTRFVPETALAKLMNAEFWHHKDQCRVETIRLPGSAADVSRRLGMDVLTTPYMQDWDEKPQLYAGNTGEPTHLLITGERLWRNTVVTLGGQKADRIEVLPDMVGITATFTCIRVPTSSLVDPGRGLDHLERTSSGAGPAPTPSYTVYNVPVTVWTSEGHTSPHMVSVVVKATPAFPPCPAIGIVRAPEPAVTISPPSGPRRAEP